MKISHLRFVQIALGLYLFVHFAHLIPWATEVFGVGGILSTPNLNKTYGIFPNILVLLPANHYVLGGFLLSLAMASLCLTADFKTKWITPYIWYGWCCLFNSNNLILNPSLPYIGWLLLALTYLSWQPQVSARGLIFSAWILLGVGYAISGWEKLLSPSWQDGSAMMHVFKNPLARDYFFRDWMAATSPSLLRLLTWGTVAAELLFLPAIFIQRTRLFFWFALVVLHLSIILVVNFADLTMGMLMIHLFVFDPDWLTKKSRPAEVAQA